jgi:glycosyltransferase involved in cell wall biosynthesis
MKIGFVVYAEPSVVTGPRNSVTLLALALAEYEGCIVSVFSPAISEPFSFNGVRILPLDCRSLFTNQIVVLTGVWHGLYLILALALALKRVRYVISPRSSLTRQQFSKSRIRKVLFLIFGGLLMLRSASRLHFLSEDERASSILRFNSFVCSNIVYTNPANENATISQSLGYLGRYDILHKGLDLLIDAISLVQQQLRKKHWRVRLHGTDHFGERAKLEELLIERGVGDIVDIGSELSGEQKGIFLNGLDYFLHTSRYEGQPQAVLEAMAAGCAVIVTTGTNMSEIVLASGSGYSVQPSPECIAEAILDGISQSPASMLAMKFKAKQCALSYFSAKSVAYTFVSNLRIN